MTPAGAASDAEAFARYRPIVDDWPAFLAASRRPLPACVWTNTLRIEAGALRRHLEDEGVDARPVPWHPAALRLPEGARPGKLWPYLAGLYCIQEEAAMLPVVLLDPRPGERVLDLCAAPGNKTAQIAVALENRGTVVANDMSFERMRALRHLVERLGLLCVSTTCHDGRTYPGPAGPFDRVLVDAPCSCEGTSRKNPRVVQELAGGGYRENVPRQRALLKRALRLCRPGGRVVYATCTYAPEENELVVQDILDDLGLDRARVVPARADGLCTVPGLTSWQGRELSPELAGALRLWPHQNDTGGFFVCVLERPAGRARTNVPPLPPVVERAPEDPAERAVLEAALAYVEERFGIPRRVFARWSAFRGKTSGFYLVAPDHRPPRLPRPDASGLFCFKTSMHYPKPSTACALAFGTHATRNVVDLGPEALADYLARRPHRLAAADVPRVEGRGYVLCATRGAVIGTGFWRPAEDATGAGTLESWYPKGWWHGGPGETG